MYIYVLAKDGTPLMPTEHAGKVRRMLRDGSAVIAGHTPFTVRLTYDTTHYVQPLTAGMDAGTTHVGISVSTDRREYYAAEVELRTDIVEKLSTRREARRTRRSKRSVRYRAPRFNNRRKPEGWLAPSTRQKVLSHVKLIEDITKFLPISEVVIEVAQFDIQRIKNPGIAGTEYQQGPQLDFLNFREYVLWRDGHECQCCHGKSKDPVLNVHHIESRKTGGNSPDNLVTLCETCHNAYHAGKVRLNLKRNFRSLRDAATKPSYGAAYEIANIAGLYNEYMNDESQESKDRADNIRELIDSVKAYEEDLRVRQKELREEDRERPTLGGYLQTAMLLSNADTADDGTDKVNLMTVHCAKGLEYDYVFVTGMEEDLFPLSGESTKSEEEEERRLFYVAVTRAKKSLTITSTVQRMRFGRRQKSLPSRFIDELLGVENEKEDDDE